MARPWAIVGPASPRRMTPRPLGTLPSGEPVVAYTLTNRAGACVEAMTYGGIITSIRVPDREGRVADVALGFNDLAGYARGHPYFGAIIGRIAGRVSGGRISVDGRDHPLASNDGPNHLHGGLRGLDKRVWSAEPSEGAKGSQSLRLSYTSPDGEEGYPGKLDITVTYTLTAAGALVVDSMATSDQATPLSLAQHTYFNLAGEDAGSLSGHECIIYADAYVPAGENMTLSDRRVPVSGTGADFRRGRLIEEALPSLFRAHGDTYLLRAPGEPQPPSPRLVARVSEGRTGRVLDVLTDEECLQFYTGSHLDGTLAGKSGRPYGRHAAFCLECQGYPNATTVAGFGDILVRPGQPQRRRTIYAFSTS